MRSQVVERLGVQVPQIQHLPPDVVSLAAAEEAIELADAYGVCDGNPLAESQKITMRGALGERADGSWAASRVGDFGPRQGTGKSDKIAVRELAGLLLFEERLIIHTAHEFPTANESFLRMAAIFENHDDLRKRVARVRYANGEQGIELLSGQRLKYRARTGGSGRGFSKAALLVYDEAQHLGREHLAASGPSKLANPNSQTWYAGSGGLASSAVAWGIRRDALGGNAGRLAYTEMTAELVALVGGRVESIRPDPGDRDAWYRAMAGLGRWVTEESMQSLFEELGPELFARECMCVWDPEMGAAQGWLFPKATWDLANDPDVAPDQALFTIDVNAERTAAAITATGIGDVRVEGGTVERMPVVELLEHNPGTGWVLGRARQLHERWDGSVFAVDGRPSAPVAALVPALREAGLNVFEVPGKDMPAACARLYDDIVEGRVRIRRHPSLDQANAIAVKTDIGDGGFTFARKNADGDISPLLAATIGLWADVEGYSDPLVMVIGGSS